MRAARAWASVPLIWAMLLWIPEFALVGDELFTSSTPRLESNWLFLLILLGFGLIEMAINTGPL